jgi:hypothetical protein
VRSRSDHDDRAGGFQPLRYVPAGALVRRADTARTIWGQAG